MSHTTDAATAIETRRQKLETLARAILGKHVRVLSSFVHLDGGHLAVRDDNRVMEVTGDQVDNEWHRVVASLDRFAALKGCR